jgi:hypothetical protein
MIYNFLRKGGSKIRLKTLLDPDPITGKNPGLRIRIHFIWIRIQHFRMNTNPDPDPIRIQGFNDQKLKKKLQLKKKLNFFLIKNCNLPIPRPP